MVNGRPATLVPHEDVHCRAQVDSQTTSIDCSLSEW